jgi:hypothetical protein
MMKAQGHGATEIAKALGMGSKSVLEALDRAQSTVTGGRVA